MKYKKMALVMALGVGLSACNNQQPAENNTQTEVIDETNNEKVDKKVEDTNQNMESVSVYASFFPIYNLTKQIAGDKFDVKSFTNLKTESHGWEPSAKDIAELSNSQVMFINGAGMEEWEESLESSSDIELVNTTKDVELIKGSHNHDHEYDDEYYNHENNYGHHHHDYEDDNGHHHHDRENDNGHHHYDYENDYRTNHHEYEDDYEHHHHDHENDNGYHHHDYEDNHEHHQHGEFDPHTWLSPKNGIAQAKVIAEKLSEIDPANRDYYMAVSYTHLTLPTICSV